MKNHLYVEFSKACAEEGIAPTLWAEKNGLNRAVPTTIKKGVRPGIDTLRKMASGWSSPESSLKIVQAYLKDELERIGVSLDDIEPVLKSAAPSPHIDADLQTLHKFMQEIPNLREGIHVVANLLKSRKNIHQ